MAAQFDRRRMLAWTAAAAALAALSACKTTDPAGETAVETRTAEKSEEGGNDGEGGMGY